EAGARPQPSARAGTWSNAQLVHRRNDELGAVLDAGGPARGDGLRLCIEPERVGAVLVEVAESRTLPSAERVVGNRHGNRNVDAHHAHLNAGREVASRIAVAGED